MEGTPQIDTDLLETEPFRQNLKRYDRAPGGFASEYAINIHGIDPRTFEDVDFSELLFVFGMDMSDPMKDRIEESFDDMGVQFIRSEGTNFHSLVPTEHFERDRFITALTSMFDERTLKVVLVNERDDEIKPENISTERAREIVEELLADIAYINTVIADKDPVEKWRILSDTLRKTDTPATLFTLFRAAMKVIAQDTEDRSLRSLHRKAGRIESVITATLIDFDRLLDFEDDIEDDEQVGTEVLEGVGDAREVLDDLEPRHETIQFDASGLSPSSLGTSSTGVSAPEFD